MPELPVDPPSEKPRPCEICETITDLDLLTKCKECRRLCCGPCMGLFDVCDDCNDEWNEEEEDDERDDDWGEDDSWHWGGDDDDDEDD